MEKEDRKPFRNALDKSDRKRFDEMFDIPRLYTSACSYAVQPVRLYPILMSILLFNFKQLTQSVSEVERIESIVKSKSKEFTKEKEEDMELLPPSPSPLRPRQLRLSEFCHLNDEDQNDPSKHVQGVTTSKSKI
jgi:hypothetical protein